jgi:tetratricopeptide (TPR) repeat protein
VPQYCYQRTAAVALLIIIATVLAYSSVRTFEFNNYDDVLYVTGNDVVKRGLTWDGIVTVFTQATPPYWHPLTMMSHMLDVELFGVNAGAHHVVNLLFHIVNSVLLFWVLYRMTRGLWSSAAVAMLFAVHPLHVESVAWVAQRKDMLSGLFALLTIWAYRSYVERRSALRYAAVVFFFALGILAKPVFVIVPVLLLILDCWPLGRWSFAPQTSVFPQRTTARLVWEKAPLFVISAVCAAVTIIAQSRLGGVVSLERFSFGVRLANAVVSYARYIGKTIWPSDLSVSYVHPGMWPWPIFIAALLLLAIVSTATVVRARRQPYLLAGWLWFLVSLLPTIGLVQAGEQAMADHFMYLPLIGPAIMIAWGIRDAAAQRTERMLPWAAATALTALVITTRVQASHWRNSESLYRHALRVDWNNATAHHLLASTLSARGDKANAVKHYFEAIRIQPGVAAVHYDVGIVLTDMSALIEATNHLARALHLNPTNIGANFHLGRALAMLGDSGGAASNYAAVLRATPDDYYTRVQLGHVYLRENNVKPALRCFEEAVRQAPTSAAARHGCGAALLKSGKTDEAIEQLRQAVQLDPKFAPAHRHLGQALAAKGKPHDALSGYREAIRLAPDFAEAWNDLAWLLSTNPDQQVRNGSEALSAARRACELSGYQQPVPLTTLASAYAEAEQFDDAIKTAELAIELAERNGQKELVARNRQLLAVYREQRPWREAIQTR